MSFGGFGGSGLLNKLKSINVNRLLNLGLGMWGLQIGSDFSKNFVRNFFAVNQTGINSQDMVDLIDVGTDLGRAALLLRFTNTLPFGNIMTPIIKISTAAVALPKVLNVMLRLATSAGGTSSTTEQGPRPRAGYYEPPVVGATATPFLQRA